jgi:hypothetical protein
MVRFFTFLFWFAVIIGVVALFLNTDIGDESLRRLADYVRVEPDPDVSVGTFEKRRMIEDRIKQLSEFSGTRSKLLHDRLALLKESGQTRQGLSDKASAYLKEYPRNIPVEESRIADLKSAVMALNGPGGGVKEAESVMQRVRDLEKGLLGMSTNLSQTAYERHASAVANMERLASRYKSMTDDLAYQKGMLANVAGRARDSNEKLRNLQQLMASEEQRAYAMTERLATQTELMQNRLAAQMERFAAMQERSNLQMERSYAQLERMYQRMEMMRDRMDSQSSRLQTMLERSAAQSERLHAMQERTSNIQQRISNLGSH